MVKSPLGEGDKTLNEINHLNTKAKGLDWSLSRRIFDQNKNGLIHILLCILLETE
jgi:hypothetical protein